MSQMFSIEDFRKEARRRLPRMVFDLVDGGAEEENTLRLNRRAFDRVTFRPRVLVDVSSRNMDTTVLGTKISLPVMLAPAGASRLVAREGELAVARAAGEAGTIFALTTGSNFTIEEVAQVATGPLWFQLYMWRNWEVTRSLVQRARNAGYQVLCITVDVPIAGKRERDLRNGMTIPPRLNLKNTLDASWRFSWLRNYLFGTRFTLGNFKGLTKQNDAVSMAVYLNKELINPSCNWEDFDRIRDLWKGPLVIKGVMCVEDALLAIEHGADGIVISNHGGRQLDCAPGTLDILPEIAKAIDNRIEVFIDGGFLRGGDVIKAIALGARACMVGRPYFWGLAVGGKDGVLKVLNIFRDEIDRTMALLGCTNLNQIDCSTVYVS